MNRNGQSTAATGLRAEGVNPLRRGVSSGLTPPARMVIALAAVLSLSASDVRADDKTDALAIIQKAIKAQGGAQKLGRIKAWTTKVRGSVQADEIRKFTGESAIQLPDRFKNVIRTNMNFGESVMIEIFDGNRGWSYVSELQGANQFQPATKPELEEMKRRAYVDYVSSLLPLLEDNKYQFNLLPSTKKGDEEVVGIRVSAAGQPEVKLFFSKKTGFLVSREFRLRDTQTDSEHEAEYRLQDYQEVNSFAQDEEILKSAKVAREPQALVDYLEKLTLEPAEHAKIEQMVKNLGDSSFEVREKAKRELIAKGSSAVPDLRRALKDSDPEIAGSAKECLREVEKSSDTHVLSAVLRLLTDAPPKGATSALLKYIPSAPNEAILQEVEAALAMVGFQNGKPDPLLKDALQDTDRERRAVAERLLDPGYRAKPAVGRPLLLRGVFTPRKETLYQDGKKGMEWDIIEVRFFEGLDSQLHFRPR